MRFNLIRYTIAPKPCRETLVHTLTSWTSQNPKGDGYHRCNNIGAHKSRVLNHFDSHYVSDGDEDGFKVFKNHNRNCREEDRDDIRHPLVKEVCRLIGLQSVWTPNLEMELKNLIRSMKPQQICDVLQFQEDERVALKLFYWADRQWRYQHAPQVYDKMLEILGKTKLHQGAKRVIRLMIRRRIRLKSEGFGYLMMSYGRAGHWRKALQVFLVMQKVNVEPNLSVYNIAVYVLVKANKLEMALKLLDRMKFAGIAPNVVTYNCLIKGYCDAARIQDAMDLIRDMPSKGCSPDKVSYNSVMGFYCKESSVKEVRVLMEKMLNESNLMPDQVTYNMLIHMLSKHGYGHEAMGFLREAEERGFYISKIEYSAIIHSFCQARDIEKAKEILKEMYNKDCIPDIVTYTDVINGLCRVGKVDEAKKLLQEVSKLGVKPNTVSHTALLNGLCHNGKSLEAREILNMSEEEWWVPNAITYSVVMHGLRREGKLSEAHVLVTEMTKKGFFPTPTEINLLIHSFCREGRPEDAKKLMEECFNVGCTINVVNYTTIIHGFCQKDDLDMAMSVLDDMYLNNINPDAVTYTAIINAFGKKGRIEEAIELIKKMLHKGLIPTPVTYRVLIHRFCQYDRVKDLLPLLEKMLSRNSCKTACNQIMEKLCSFGNLDEAYKFVGNVLRTASKTDADTCHMLMKNYLMKGDPMSSYKVACRMFNRNLIPNLRLCEKVSKSLILQGKSHDADKLMLKFVERGKISPQYRKKIQA